MLWRELHVLSLFLFILTILRENIGLSVGQFVQFWSIVLFLFSFPYHIV